MNRIFENQKNLSETSNDGIAPAGDSYILEFGVDLYVKIDCIHSYHRSSDYDDGEVWFEGCFISNIVKNGKKGGKIYTNGNWDANHLPFWEPDWSSFDENNSRFENKTYLTPWKNEVPSGPYQGSGLCYLVKEKKYLLINGMEMDDNRSLALGISAEYDIWAKYRVSLQYGTLPLDELKGKLQGDDDGEAFFLTTPAIKVVDALQVAKGTNLYRYDFKKNLVVAQVSDW